MSMAQILTAPQVSWFNVDKVNPAKTNEYEIRQPYDFGIVDAGHKPEPENYYQFLIWNNRKSNDYAPKMEDVTIGVKDVNGGIGNEVGSEVWAINGEVKWFWAYVDSLNETDSDFAQIGADLTKPIGTKGTTLHPSSLGTIKPWVASTNFSVGDIVSPQKDNGNIYKVITGGTSGTVEPTWSTVEGEKTTDGVIAYETIKKAKTPELNNIILGGANDGTVGNSAGNFAKVTLKVEVPLDSRSGRQDFKLRVSYRYV